MVLRNLAQKEFSCIWGSKWVGVIGIEVERTQIHFLSDVFVAVAVCYKDLASDPSGYCLGCIHEFRKLFYKCIVIFSSVSETLWSFLPFFLTFSSFLWANFREEDKALNETENHFTEHASHHHHHQLNHTDGKCEFCDYIRVKRLLEHLNKWVFQILQWVKRIFCLKLLQRKRWDFIITIASISLED